jgi:hypothetical protein
VRHLRGTPGTVETLSAPPAVKDGHTGAITAVLRTYSR